MYHDLYDICRNTERMMTMFFSEELKILDDNTVKYMIDQYEEEKKAYEKEKQIYEKEKTLSESTIAAQKETIAKLEAELAKYKNK